MLPRLLELTTAPVKLHTSVRVTRVRLLISSGLPTDSTALAREQDSKLHIMKYARGSIGHCVDTVLNLCDCYKGNVEVESEN